MLKLQRLSNNPIVGQWIPLTEKQNRLALAAMTELDKANVEYGGSAEVSFRENDNKRWPAMLVRLYGK